MPLCPACFNAPAYCECDPPYRPTAEELGRDGGGVPAAVSKETCERLVADVHADRREAVRGIVDGLTALGAWLETPPAIVPDYVNVRVPAAKYGEARLCSIHRKTGRIEFQDGSHPLAEGLGVGDRFDYLAAGDKAAITPTSGDVQAVLELAGAVLASRRASGW